MTKSEAKRIRHTDFIPNGPRVDLRTLKFRETAEHEVYHCCAMIGDDPQSGPIFCGDISDFLSAVDGGIVTLCNGHAKRFGIQSI